MSDLVEVSERISAVQARLPALRAQIDAYIRESIEVFSIPDSSVPGHKTYCGRARTQVPTSIKVDARQIINELRSSLNNLLFVLFQREGVAPNNVHFPVYKSEEGFHTDGLKRLRQLSEDVVDKIVSLKPFKGGHPFLFQMVDLDNHEKHESLAPSFFGSTGIQLPGMRVPPNTQMIGNVFQGIPQDFLYVEPLSMNAQMQIGSTIPLARVAGRYPSFSFIFDVVYLAPESVNGYVLFEFVERCAESVADIVELFCD